LGINIADDISKLVAVAYSEAMKYRFLLHSVSHTTVAVNITGLSVNIAGVRVNGSSLPFIQFTSWNRAKGAFSGTWRRTGISQRHGATTKKDKRRRSDDYLT
jgi:hypothetical protein